MTAYVALLRGVNLGRRQLKMDDLRRIAGDLGLESAKTYIASGNLLFASRKSEKALKDELEAALAAHMGTPVGVMIRSAKQLMRAVKANPFPDEPANRVVAIFLDDPPPKTTADQARNVDGERIALGEREVYVHYPNGQGKSKIVIPAVKAGTARNMNTVAKLAELAKGIS